MASITVYISRVQNSNIASVSYSAWHSLQHTFPGFKVQIYPLFHILHGINYRIYFQGTKFKHNLFPILHGINYRIQFQGSKFKHNLFQILHGILYCIHFQGSKFIKIINNFSIISLTKQKQAVLIISLCCVLYTCSTWDGCWPSLTMYKSRWNGCRLYLPNTWKSWYLFLCHLFSIITRLHGK